MQDTRRDIDRLKLEIREREEEMASLQRKCKHNPTVKNVGSTGDSKLRVVCDTCDAILGYPTRDEILSWID